MKILSRKQQDEILKRMIALQVIFNKPVIEIRTPDENEAKKWQKNWLIWRLPLVESPV